jgi:hypothetical protein
MESISQFFVGWFERAHVMTRPSISLEAGDEKTIANYSLTSSSPLVSFSSVSNSAVKNRWRRRRLLSIGLLLFIFFLPLHFHFSPASQLNKDCSCAQGTRKQLALADNPPVSFAPLRAIFITVLSTSVWIDSYSRPQNVRGPPFTVSL